MRGYFAFLVIIVSVFVTVQAANYNLSFKDSLYLECGINQWGTDSDSTRKYHNTRYYDGKFNYTAVIKNTKENDPMGCQRSCSEKRNPRCEVFNLRPLTKDNVLTCQLLKLHTNLLSMNVNEGPESHTYTGGNTCLMDAPGCFEKSCYDQLKGNGLIKVGCTTITARGQRTPLKCQQVCDGLTKDGKRCTHTSFELRGNWMFSYCHLYHLKFGTISRYLNNHNCPHNDPHNFWSGPAKCPCGCGEQQLGIMKVPINL